MPTKLQRNRRVQVYLGDGLIRRWRYRVVAANGEVVESSEAYFSKWNAKRAARQNVPDAVIEVL